MGCSRCKTGRKLLSSKEGVSHHVEFTVAFAVIAAGLLFIFIATNHLFVPQEPEMEHKDYVTKSMILSEKLVNEVGNWSENDNSEVFSLGLAYQDKDGRARSGVLDYKKIYRLQKCVNYTTARLALGLKSYDFRLQIIGKANRKLLDFGKAFENIGTVATTKRVVYVYNKSAGVSEPATLMVTVSMSGEEISFNRYPHAYSQNVSTNESTPVNITLNASDPDVLDKLNYTISREPTNGNLSGKLGIYPYGSHPTVTYTPHDGFYGSDSFEFKVDDGYGGMDSAVVNISVVAVVPHPIARDFNITLFENTSVDINVVENASYHPPDHDNNDTMYVDNSSIVKSPSEGNASVVSNTTIMYTPKDIDNITYDNFTYRIYDANRSYDDGRVNVTICPASGWYCNNSYEVEYREYYIGVDGGCGYRVTNSSNCTTEYGPWEYYCENASVYRKRTVTFSWCEDGECKFSSASESEFYQDCGNSSCGPWSDPYCDGNYVKKQRTCYIRGCSSISYTDDGIYYTDNASCYNISYIEEITVENCSSLTYCLVNSSSSLEWCYYCNGSELRRYSTCYVYNCSNGKCIMQSYLVDELVEHCSVRCVQIKTCIAECQDPRIPYPPEYYPPSYGNSSSLSGVPEYYPPSYGNSLDSSLSGFPAE
ncbi:MAG TPA: hypothetical protein EYP23_04775 [Thermoplasmata archaeon]|nr:hypothetical protein [Thermoplasmata archaeon]